MADANANVNVANACFGPTTWHTRVQIVGHGFVPHTQPHFTSPSSRQAIQNSNSLPLANLKYIDLASSNRIPSIKPHQISRISIHLKPLSSARAPPNTVSFSTHHRRVRSILVASKSRQRKMRYWRTSSRVRNERVHARNAEESKCDLTFGQ